MVVADREGEQLGQRFHVSRRRGGRRQQRLQLLEPSRRRVVTREPGRALELGHERVQGTVLAVRRAGVVQEGVRLVAEMLLHRRQQPRLADPRLAREQHHLALAALGPLPAPQQQAHLLLAPDQREQGRGVERLEPARRRADAEDPVRPDRLGEALGLDAAEIGALEEAADEPARAGGDDDAVRLGQPLQPRGQVRGLADHRLLARGAAADQVAHHHQPRRDPDPGGQRLAFRRGQPADGPQDVQPGPDRALGVVLVGPGEAEVGEHAVAHELGDVPLEAGDLARDRVLVGADDLAQVLGIEAGREGGRADEVDEHHRELPPLGLRSRRDRSAATGAGSAVGGRGTAGRTRAAIAARSACGGRARRPRARAGRPRSASAAGPASTSLSRNAPSYRPRPSPRSQAPTSTPVPLIGRARPVGCSLSRAATERVMEQPERSAFSSPVAGKAVRATFDGGRLTSDARRAAASRAAASAAALTASVRDCAGAGSRGARPSRASRSGPARSIRHHVPVPARAPARTIRRSGAARPASSLNSPAARRPAARPATAAPRRRAPPASAARPPPCRSAAAAPPRGSAAPPAATRPRPPAIPASGNGTDTIGRRRANASSIRSSSCRKVKVSGPTRARVVPAVSGRSSSSRKVRLASSTWSGWKRVSPPPITGRTGETFATAAKRAKKWSPGP